MRSRGRREERVRRQPAGGGPHVYRAVSARRRRAVRPERVGRVRCERLSGGLNIRILGILWGLFARCTIYLLINY